MLCNRRDASGRVVREKAQLAAKGYTQVARMGFIETFVSMAKIITISCHDIFVGT